MLQVGIHENVKLGSETDIQNNNGNESLVINLVKTSGLSTFDALVNDNAVVDESSNVFVNDFRFSMKKFDSEEMKSTGELAKLIKRFRMFLKEFLMIYLTDDKIEETFGSKKIFEELGITSENINEELPKESTMNRVYKAICTAFVETCKANNLYDREETFRIKLVRQSAAKNFPTFTKYTWEPWIESMDIDTKDSKIVFTADEKNKGLDSSAMAASDSVPETDANTAEDLYKDPSINDTFPPLEVQ